MMQISQMLKIIFNMLQDYCSDSFIVSSIDNSPAIRGITKINESNSSGDLLAKAKPSF